MLSLQDKLGGGGGGGGGGGEKHEVEGIELPRNDSSIAGERRPHPHINIESPSPSMSVMQATSFVTLPNPTLNAQPFSIKSCVISLINSTAFLSIWFSFL